MLNRMVLSDCWTVPWLENGTNLFELLNAEKDGAFQLLDSALVVNPAT
jgi:hypothetical protein